MPAVQFDQDAMARWYAVEHIKTDPGIIAVWYLPAKAEEREIRFVEINQLMSDRNDRALEPIDFGIDTGTETAHRLYVLDVTPDQWRRIQEKTLPLPDNWSIKGAKQLL